MRVDVQLFAGARQRSGRSIVSLELQPGATVADLKRALLDEAPELAAIMPGLWIAVDADYAQDDDPIPAQAEVAVIPPVSGGSRGPDALFDPAVHSHGPRAAMERHSPRIAR